MNNNKVEQENINMDVFLGMVKKEDNNLKLILKVLKILYIVIIVVNIPLFYYKLQDGMSGFQLCKMAATIMGSLGILLSLSFSYKKMKSISYSESILKSLKTIAKRYRLFKLIDFIVFIFIVIFLLGIVLNEQGYLAFKDLDYTKFKLGTYLSDAWQLFTGTDNCLKMISKTTTEFPLLNVLFTFSIICSTIILSFIAGIAIWVHRHKPIRDNALELIREIES